MNWVAVTARVPQQSGTVLVWCKHSFPQVDPGASFSFANLSMYEPAAARFSIEQCDGYKVSHWAEIDPPMEAKT